MNKRFLLIGLSVLALPLPVLADETALGQAQSFGELVSIAWSYGAQVILGLAVFLIVLGAFFYLLSAGSEERMTSGKQLIWGATIAILIVLFSGVILRVLHQPAEGTTGNLAEIPNVIRNATRILVGAIEAFAVLMLTYGGLLYATAKGDENRLAKAHRSIQYAAYGLVLGLLAYGIVTAIVNFFT